MLILDVQPLRRIIDASAGQVVPGRRGGEVVLCLVAD